MSHLVLHDPAMVAIKELIPMRMDEGYRVRDRIVFRPFHSDPIILARTARASIRSDMDGETEIYSVYS